MTAYPWLQYYSNRATSFLLIALSLEQFILKYYRSLFRCFSATATFALSAASSSFEVVENLNLPVYKCPVWKNWYLKIDHLYIEFRVHILNIKIEVITIATIKRRWKSAFYYVFY